MEQPSEKRRLGRPSGRDYPIIKQVRLAPEDAEDLEFIANELRGTESGAVRYAIHETAERLRKSSRKRRGPRDFTESELKRVGVTITDPHSVALRCDECGGVWSPMLQRGGKFPRGYWRCPHHGCNTEEAAE
jgi:hypothetical protein